MDCKKVRAIIEWPTPKNLTALRGLLGLTGYYRKFIRGYSTLAAPLTALTKKHAFHWIEQAQRAFEVLKQPLTSLHVLALPDFNAPFIIECNASSIRTGAVLMQRNHPTA